MLSVLPDAVTLSLSSPLSAQQPKVEARVQARLLDNRWHDIHLLYEEATLHLIVDKQSVVVGKSGASYIILDQPALINRQLQPIQRTTPNSSSTRK